MIESLQDLPIPDSSLNFHGTQDKLLRIRSPSEPSLNLSFRSRVQSFSLGCLGAAGAAQLHRAPCARYFV